MSSGYCPVIGTNFFRQTGSVSLKRLAPNLGPVRKGRSQIERFTHTELTRVADVVELHQVDLVRPQSSQRRLELRRAGAVVVAFELGREKDAAPQSGLGDEVAQRLPGSEASPAQAWDDSHLDGDIQAALQALPPDYRAAVVLCDIEGFSYEEIAATMGVKLGTVRSRIHRGRAQLRAALAHRERRVRER